LPEKEEVMADTQRLVLRKFDDGTIEEIGTYEGATSKKAQNAALADTANETLRQDAKDDKVLLAAPPVNSVQFEERGIDQKFV
jgi:hypothetical protein